MKSVSKVGLLALACAGTANAVSQYILSAEDTYQGMSFFDKFDFFSASQFHIDDPSLTFNRLEIQMLDSSYTKTSKLLRAPDLEGH